MRPACGLLRGALRPGVKGSAGNLQGIYDGVPMLNQCHAFIEA